MLNIIVAITAFIFWYVTGDIWPAVLGGILAIMIWDELWLLSIIISAAIIGLCAYFFWVEIIFHMDQNDILKQMAVTVIYMVSVFVKVVGSFK